MATFAVQLTFDGIDNERRLAVRPAHRDYLASLREAGKLVAAGPFVDESGALLVYEVADEAELREIIAKDPYSAEESYVIASLHEWNTVFPPVAQA